MTSIRTFSFCSLFAILLVFSSLAAGFGQTTDFKAVNPPSLPPAHGYSHIVIAPPGRFVSISGQVAMDSTGTVVGSGNFAAQCEQVHQNLQCALHSIGLTFENVIRTDIYVTTLEHLDALRKCRTHYLPAENPPTATLIKVESLFNPKLMIEVAVTAIIPYTSTSD